MFPQTDPTYKLYVSPQVEAMPAVFAKVLQAMSTRTMGFKIGSSAAGLLRPDKMVLYFDDRQSLQAVASELAKLFPGVAAHGVPFTAEITSDGLLSWGMDPPQRERRLAWQDVESWRLWVVRRLAIALIAAHSNPSDRMSPADFALERLRHEGVDVDDWTPASRLWRATQ
jgi:hypothetical protein